MIMLMLLLFAGAMASADLDGQGPVVLGPVSGLQCQRCWSIERLRSDHLFPFPLPTNASPPVDGLIISMDGHFSSGGASIVIDLDRDQVTRYERGHEDGSKWTRVSQRSIEKPLHDQLVRLANVAWSPPPLPFPPPAPPLDVFEVIYVISGPNIAVELAGSSTGDPDWIRNLMAKALTVTSSPEASRGE
jgi:hypothetical protein